MELKDAIYGRRSIRKYTDKKVEKEIIEQLIDFGIQAPSAMNSQAWSFGVIQDKNLLTELSNETKAYLLSILDTNPFLASYKNTLENPNFDIFYNCPLLLLVCMKPGGIETNACLAAQNIMLAAHNLGLGSCWIGFCHAFLNIPKNKEKFGIPSDYSIVAPLIIGYPAAEAHPVQKNEAEIIFWK